MAIACTQGWSSRCIACAACATLAACSFFVPDTRTPSDRAKKVEPKCRDVTDAAIEPLLSGEAIDSVGPAYAYVSGGPNGREARMRGARIHVRPLAGMSRESIARGLECHEARTTLGLVAARAGDPYTLPNRWLSIDVDSEGDGFVVVVATDDHDDARLVLQRAKSRAVANDRAR
jgi:hypothetical protein